MISKFFNSLLKIGQYYFYISIIDRAISFFFFLAIAKRFSVEDYGQMVTVFVVSSIVLTIFDFGLQIYVQRESAIKNTIDEILSSVLFIKTFSLFFYYLFVFTYLLFTNPDIPIYHILIISTISLLINISTLLSYVFYGKNKTKNVFIITVSTKIVFIIAIIVLFYLKSNFVYFLLILMMTNLLQMIFLIIDLRRNKIFIKIKLEYFKKGINVLKLSYPLGLAVLFNHLYDRIDIVLISRIVNNESVGQYNIAYSINKLVSILFGVIFIYGFNIFSKNVNEKSNFNYLFYLSIPIVILSIVCTFLIYFFGGFFLHLLFDNKYLLAENILPLLSFSVLGFGLNSLTGVFINANGKFKGVMLCTIAGLIVNIIYNILFLPKIGVYAAVYSTIITEYTILFLESIYIYFFIYRMSYGHI